MLIPGWRDNSWCNRSSCSVRFCCNLTYGEVPLEIHVEAELDEDDSDCWSSDAEVVSEKKEKIIIILDPLDFSKTPEIYPLPKYI